MRFIACLIAASFVVASGCQPAADPLVQQSQQQYLTSECPSDAKTIGEMTEQEELPGEVTLAGRIYGGDFSPFDPQAATFTMIDLPAPGHNHEDPGDCPFCKHKADNAAMAVVRLLGDDGQPLKVPADKLLGLTKNQDIVVRGVPTKVDDMLMLDATAVHVLNSDDAVKLSEQFELQRDTRKGETAVSTQSPSETGSPAS
jgi:hypothetical protein